MVSSTDSSLPPSITVLYQEYRGEVSLRQIARDLGADLSNVRKAKNWLIENRHPAFTNYLPDSLLNSEQADAIILCRSYTTQGIKGDALTEKMFPNVVTFHAKKDALRDLFEKHHIPPEQAAQLTHAILVLFNP